MLPTDAEYYTNERGKITFYKEIICPNLKIKLLEYFDNGEWKLKCRGYIPWAELIPINPILSYEI